MARFRQPMFLGRFWAGFGHFRLAREVGGLRLKRYRPLQVNRLSYVRKILTECKWGPHPTFAKVSS